MAIESAIAGGSLALLVDGKVVQRWHSAESHARGEEHLARAASLIELSGIERTQITRIAVSNGPGSYTGIRIGLATAMGLARALKVPCTGVGLLTAMATISAEFKSRIVAVPIGRNGYCWQHFNAHEGDAIGSGPIDDLLAAIAERPEAKVVAQSDAYEILSEKLNPADCVRIIDHGRDLAVAVGLVSADADDGLEPFYARDTAIQRPREVSS
ncbi:MAG: tRNA (adenosine(37)-N6)-threonylcarbamoyltransferase complex dimerization subunit type 1 TsaB [Pyrinomonadaceae bacterium]